MYNIWPGYRRKKRLGFGPHSATQILHVLNPLQNFAQKLEIALGRSNRLFKPLLQLIFAFVVFPALKSTAQS
jgi:hypothetical protein